MRLAHVVRPLQEATRLDPKQFAILLGLRASASTFGPLLIGLWVGHPAYRWAAIAGFCATTSDKGGPYATRAKTFLVLGVAGCFAVLIGTLSASSLPWSVGLAMCVVSMGALARILGNEAISIGTVSSILFLLANAQPEPSTALALERVGLVALGVGWAAALGLVVWPVRMFAPARRVVAEAFQALAVHAETVAARIGNWEVGVWHADLQREHAEVRTAVENARRQLASIRGNSRGASAKGAWLLGLLQTADQAFGRLIALTEAFEGTSAPLGVRRALATQLIEVARACQALAEYAVDENEHAPVPRAAISTEALLDAVNSAQPPLAPLPRAQLIHVGELLMSIDHTLETVTPVTQAATEPMTPWWVTLRAGLSFESVELRHALRVGVVVATSVAVTTAFEIDHGYWATITMLTVLQPHAPATFTRAVQRVGGTVCGALLALAIAAMMPGPQWLIPICMVMSAVSVSMIQVNYGLYAALLTPTFVLLAQINGFDPRLPEVRALLTTVAGVLALVASRLIWPTSERTRIADELARALGALKAMVETVAHRPAAADAVLAAGRRTFGVAINNADVSFQRIVAEQSFNQAELEPAMTMLLYMRRVSWAALAVPTLPGAPSMPADLAQACDGILDELQSAASVRRVPEPLGTMGIASSATDPLLRSQLDRLVQHLQVLHDAQTRLARGPLMRD